MVGSSLVDAPLAASQEGLGSMKLLSTYMFPEYPPQSVDGI
jgi:hypothetical protein